MKKWTKAEEEELRQLYSDKSLTIDEIAERIGRSADGVTFHAAKLGLRRSKILEQHEREIRNMYLGGAPVPYIAKCFNVTVIQIRNKLIRMKLVRNQRRDSWTPDDDKELRRLFDLKFSSQQIARRMGRTDNAIRHRLVALHLHRRPKTRLWEPREERQLVLLYEKQKKPVAEIAEMLNYSIVQVYNKAARMRLVRR